MKLKQACRARRIPRIDVDTPLLVPSFSSVIIENIAEIHEKLQEYISVASLVSAYDLHYGYIAKEAIRASDVVFIDSGTYEIDNLANSTKRKDWSLSMYEETVVNLRPVSRAVLVNYDRLEPLKEQVSNARRFFEAHPEYAACFLCKPIPGSMGLIDVSGLTANITLLEAFDILGVTEKELGNSLLKRCENLLRIKEALDNKGLTIPLHVFGCLDPLSIVSYFLCGADIFDGPAWLKFGFHRNTAVYVNNYALLQRSWSDSDLSVRVSSYVLNLRELGRLISAMRRFTREYDLNVFRFEEDAVQEIKDLTSAAGLEY
jgi:hypothetical protein